AAALEERGEGERRVRRPRRVARGVVAGHRAQVLLLGAQTADLRRSVEIAGLQPGEAEVVRRVPGCGLFHPARALELPPCERPDALEQREPRRIAVAGE